MAQVQYRRAAKPAGYQPVAVGGQAIARMREESARMADAMRAARSAEIEDRKRVQAAMQEEQQYTRRAEDRNFEIQTKNDANRLRQSQFDAQTAARQFEIQQQETASVLKSVSNFSQTASEKLTELRKQQFEEDAQKGYAKFSEYDPDTIKQIYLEGELYREEELRQGAIDEAEAKGAPSLTIAQLRSMNSATRYGFDQALANYMLTEVYPQELHKFRLENPTQNSAESAAQLATFEREFYQRYRLLELPPAMVRDGIAAVRRVNQSIQIKERERDVVRYHDISNENAFNAVTPTNVVTALPAYFRTLLRDPRLTREEALSKAFEFGTIRNAQGELAYSLVALAQVDLKGTGKGLAKEFPKRWAPMLLARLRSENSYRQAVMASEDIAFEQKARELLDGLIAEPTKGNADAAVDFLRETFGKDHPDILKFQASFTTEAKIKAKSIEQLEAIPDGFITQEAVDAMMSLDPTAARRLNERFAAQERRYNSGIYKDTAESFKATTNGATAFGSNKNDTAASVFLLDRMQAVYRKRVDEAVAGGMDFNQAATTIGQQLDAEVKAGLLNPTSLWYRKVDGPGGAAAFPNLNKGAVSAAEQARRRYAQLKQNIKTNGVQQVINTKNSIITEQEAQQIVKNYGKPGFTIPQDVLAVAGMTNGLDPMVIINAQLAQHGIAPLQPPPSLSSTAQTVSPAFRKLLFKNPTPNTSTRALGSANIFNPAIIPNNLGGFIQEAAQASGVNPSFIAALAEIESTFNPNSTSYNGSSFGVMQINRAAHPNFFATQNWRDPRANINYGAQYYAGLLRKYNDPVAAAMAYNAGPGNYDAYLKGQLPDGRVKTEMLNHGKKFSKAMYKYGGGGMSLNNPHLLRSNNQKLTASASSYIGMDTSDGPDVGRNACVWALNKVMRAAGMNVPWGDSLYVPTVKKVLDKAARRVSSPVPGAIAIMQDNHPTDPYPHIGIVGADGMIISNSTSRARFDWRGTPQEYEQKYGRPNLYYILN